MHVSVYQDSLYYHVRNDKHVSLIINTPSLEVYPGIRVIVKVAYSKSY